ncbi:MAG: DNA polymerase family X protein [Edafosvirus sp.]|uniref:DNA-directed DNA polymerase n=1 Tax=Edafosvirus sp. TaxID=2487765 RepID=A0A3G4ZU57_9VIRU|nr:MAG: DNA polymerase family X protein [Edafosvirus sp.]
MEKNKKIIDELNNLIKQIQFEIDHSGNKKDEIKNMFRLKSIKNATKIISKYPKEIKSGEQLKDVKGVGKGVISRINEILQQGKLEEVKLDEDSDKYLEAINDLENVFGVGRKTAFDFVKNYNINSVEELQKAYKEGKITLNDNIKMGLKYYNIYKQSIPREEVFKIDTFLHNVIIKIDPELFGIICGSYRRQQLTSNDIDFLIVHPSIQTKKDLIAKKNYLKILVNILITNGFIIDSLTSGDIENKYMGFCQLKEGNKLYPVHRLDIRYLPYDSYYAALLYFTGPGDFNRRMRLIAIEQGFMLNEYGIYITENKGKNKIIKKKLKVNSEKEIFDILGMEYLEPENRK